MNDRVTIPPAEDLARRAREARQVRPCPIESSRIGWMVSLLNQVSGRGEKSLVVNAEDLGDPELRQRLIAKGLRVEDLEGSKVKIIWDAE